MVKGLGSSLAERVLPWLGRQLTQVPAPGKSLCVGISGAPGAGKTTLVKQLQQHLMRRGLQLQRVSLDDFYLSKPERLRLARTVHPLFETRGVPGTHDIGWLSEVIDRLLSGAGAVVPRFDKATDDRAPRSTWLELAPGPCDLVLLEGWCVGLPAQAPLELLQPVNDLERLEDATGLWRRSVNEALATTYQQLFARLDRVVALVAPSFENVIEWRQQQEQELAESVARTLSPGSELLLDAERLQRFLAHFERLLCHAKNELPGRADLTLFLDDARGVARVVERRLEAAAPS